MSTDQTPAPPATIDDAPKDKPDGKPIDNLVDLIREMEPFLDSFGVAHCMLPTGNSNGQSAWRLNDEAVEQHPGTGNVNGMAGTRGDENTEKGGIQ